MPMSCVTNSNVGTPRGVQDAHHVRLLILLVVAAIRPRREAQPTQVGRDNHVVFDECARQMPPHVARCAEAMQHNDRWTVTADPHMDGCTVGFDRPRLHRSREGINPIYVVMFAHLYTPDLLPVEGIGGPLRGGTAISCAGLSSSRSRGR